MDIFAGYQQINLLKAFVIEYIAILVLAFIFRFIGRRFYKTANSHVLNGLTIGTMYLVSLFRFLGSDKLDISEAMFLIIGILVFFTLEFLDSRKKVTSK